MLMAAIFTPVIAESQGVRVAAAASLRQVWPELMAAYSTDVEPRVSFSSSGNLLRQIRQGAPFELFLSADETYANSLVDAGLTQGSGTVYTTGQLALILAPKNGATATENLTVAGTIEQLLAVGPAIKFSIANPQHAPYGVAAKEYLQNIGKWDRVSSHLVLGENASQALQFVLVGAAAGGIVPLSLVVALEAPLTSYTLDTHLHEPLHHRMVLTNNAEADAMALYHYLSSTTAQQIFRRYGFVGRTNSTSIQD